MRRRRPAVEIAAAFLPILVSPPHELPIARRCGTNRPPAAAPRSRSKPDRPHSTTRWRPIAWPSAPAAAALNRAQRYDNPGMIQAPVRVATCCSRVSSASPNCARTGVRTSVARSHSAARISGPIPIHFTSPTMTPCVRPSSPIRLGEWRSLRRAARSRAIVRHGSNTSVSISRD